MNFVKFIVLLTLILCSHPTTCQAQNFEEDDIPPSFGDTCPSPLEVAYIGKCQEKYEYELMEPKATDNSQKVVNVTKLFPENIPNGEKSPFKLPIGVYNFRYIAKDENFNVEECQFTVLVLVRPSCPDNYSLPINSGLIQTRTCGSKYGSEAKFKCQASENVVMKFSCTDSDWKKTFEEPGECLNVTEDKIPPVFNSCPPSLQTLYVSECSAEVEYKDIPKTATDSQDGPVKIESYLPEYITNSEPYKLPPGLHHFKFVAEDNSGNKAVCQFKVLVLMKPRCPKELNSKDVVRCGTEGTCGDQHGSVIEACCQLNTDKIVSKYKCVNGDWIKLDPDDENLRAISSNEKICKAKNDDSKPEEDDLSTGEVVGIGIGCAVGGFLISGLAVYFANKKRTEPSANEEFFDNPLANQRNTGNLPGVTTYDDNIFKEQNV